MNKCAHTFVKTGEYQYAGLLKSYVIVVCPYCGHTRHIHSDGKIEIIRDTGRVTFKKNDE